MSAVVLSKEMDGRDIKVVVGICTCRSPNGIYKLLSELDSHHSIYLNQIIVVDNDIGRQGLKVVEGFSFSAEVAIHAVVEERAGIPFARNRLIRESLEFDFDYLAMIDDDEYPAVGWLDNLVHCASNSKADVVGGPVEPVFESAVIYPALPIDFMKTGGIRKGTNITVNSTANVLLSKRLIQDWNENWFDIDMAHSGGTDTEFFWRVYRAGYGHAVAPNALVYEDISSTRATPSWLLNRAFRNGNTLTTIRRKSMGQVVGSVREFGSAFVTLAFSMIGMLVSGPDVRKNFLYQMQNVRARGKISALLGNVYEEYGRRKYR